LFLLIVFAWLALAAMACLGALHSQRDRPPIPPGTPFSAVLIIPVRGVPPTLAALWAGLRAQSYDRFRVVFAVESLDDPACAALQALPDGPPRELVVAGPTTQRAQKAHNLLAALPTVRDSDDFVVFADADIAPTPDWLARLMRALSMHPNEIVSGNRWMVPADDRWSTAFTCVANSSVATIRRRHRFNVAWGGSMVLHRQAIDLLELTKCWDRAGSVDLSLTRCVWAHGGCVIGPRDALVPSPVAYGWKEAVAFARRQYLVVRMYAPLQWSLAAAVFTIPAIGWVWAIPLAALGDRRALAAIAAAYVLDYSRARLRARIPMKLWNMPIAPRVAWLDRWATPLWLWFHLGILWSTLFGRRITWAGRTYVIDRNRQVSSVIVERPADGRVA
jgi:hypothetical protein